MKKLPDEICFTNGYGKNRPSMTVEVLDWSLQKSHHPEWGGNTIAEQFIFTLGKILSTKNI